MIGGTAGNQLLALRMECVIELFYFQDLLPSQDDKRLIQRKAQYLIRCHQFAACLLEIACVRAVTTSGLSACPRVDGGLTQQLRHILVRRLLIAA